MRRKRPIDFAVMAGLALCIVVMASLPGSEEGSVLTSHASASRTHVNVTQELTPRAYLPYISKPHVVPSCPPLDMPDGSLEVQAEPGKGFLWPYFVYTPSSIESEHPLVVPNNSGQASDDFCLHRERAHDLMSWLTTWADDLGTPLIVPIFPRPLDETDWSIASQYLGRGTLEEYWQQRYPALSRQDLQLIAMIDDVRSTFACIPMDAKVLLWGHSASGMFVSRFTILHPDRVQATAVGGHGWTTAPVTDWDGLSLPFPYGADDVFELTGMSVDLEAFRAVPLYVYMGSEDTNGWGLPWYIGMENDHVQYYESFVQKFGASAPSLLTSAQTIFDSLGCTASFVLYPEAGHAPTPEMFADVLGFLNSHR